MHTDSWRRLRATGCFLLFIFLGWFVGGEAWAASKELLTGQGGVSVPLQQVVRVERVRGPIFVAIPAAYVFGIGGDRNAYYCSPSIRASNSSNYTVEELIIGIAYKSDKGQAVGSSVTNYTEIKVGREITDHFYKLSTQDCRGITGEVTVLRCRYASGEDCLTDLHVTAFGAIPLRMKLR